MNNIALIPNENKDKNFIVTKKVTEYLHTKNIIIHDNMDNPNIDLIITLGGDGSILRIAEKAAIMGVPIIGVNLGRIGFMSEIEVDEIELLDNLFTGNYIIEKRMMLDITVKRNGETTVNERALNDAVISHGNVSRLIEIILYVNGKELNKYRADGVITATPTGSTAYSMSAGGPIIDPLTDCFVITPICPHSIVNRPIVLSNESVISFYNKETDGVYLTVDGQKNIKLQEDDEIIIKQADIKMKLISIKTHGFYQVLKNKMFE